ncbi:putative quinol monooxygenase [Comamonas sp. GB3 AK4-5]|uniref:putative quinol monooxygenase n=1 Tax=Comamonas sp. GB3 AK4-5 TaxID=3231487 RepID=UPI00351E74F2
MFHSGYYVTAELRLKDLARLDEACLALKVLAEKTLLEPGCSIFVVHHDSATSSRFVLWERFDDEAAFRLHFEQAHTLSYLAQDLTEVVQHFATDVL